MFLFRVHGSVYSALLVAKSIHTCGLDSPEDDMVTLPQPQDCVSSDICILSKLLLMKYAGECLFLACKEVN